MLYAIEAERVIEGKCIDTQAKYTGLHIQTKQKLLSLKYSSKGFSHQPASCCSSQLPNALKPTPPIIPQQVGGASICAASEVLEALSSSTLEVVSSGATAASDAIGHRYGEDAGNAAQQGLCAVQSATQAACNVWVMGSRRSLLSTSVKVIWRDHRSSSSSSIEFSGVLESEHAPAIQQVQTQNLTLL